MKYRVLKSYLSYCKQNSLTPNRLNLIDYKNDLEEMGVLREWLREELYRVIERFGVGNIRTIDKSQELDRALNKESVRLRQQTQSS